MKNLVIVKKSEYGGEPRTEVVDLATACRQRWLDSDGLDISTTGSGKELDELSEAAPNLALNVKNATAPWWELWLWAAVGIALQAAALVVPLLATYRWEWKKAGVPVAPYGYPCFVAGTILVIVGVMFCGHVIEGITTERYFAARPESYAVEVTKIIRLQRACTVSDQHFSSYVISNSPGDLDIRTSRLSKRKYRYGPLSSFPS